MQLLLQEVVFSNDASQLNLLATFNLSVLF